MARIRLVFLLLLSSLVSISQAASLQDARARYHAGDLKSALAQTNQLLSADSNSIPALFLKAQIQSESRSLDDAIATYKSIVSLDPAHLEAYNNLAALYAQQGKLKLASEMLETAIGTDPVFTTIHTNLRAIYMDMSQKHYRQALKLKTEDNPTLIASIDMGESAPQILDEEVQIVPGSIQDAINMTVASNPPPKRRPLPETASPVPDKKAQPTATRPPDQTQKQGTEAAEKPGKATGTQSSPRSQVKAKPVAKKQTDARADSTAEVKKALLAWANAWSNRDVKRYVGAYTDSYATFGRSHKDWVAGRNWNFRSKKYIKVDLSEIRIEADGNRYRARFKQRYQSDSYQDLVNKELLFVRQAGNWKIAKETAG